MKISCQRNPWKCYLFLLWFIIGRGSFSLLPAQTLIFEENFDNWSGSPACPDGWLCMTTSDCVSDTACYWGPEDQFDPTFSPIEQGCDNSEHYARSHTSQLRLGERVSITSPVIDLSLYPMTDSLSVNFCYINASETVIDTDGIWVQMSGDGGVNWALVYIDIVTVYNSWQQISLSIPPIFRSSLFRVRFEALGDQASLDLGIDLVQVVRSSVACEAGTSTISTQSSTTVCLNGPATPTTFVRSTETGLNPAYLYLVVDEEQNILEVLGDSVFDFRQLGAGIYTVWGIAYVGDLNAEPGMNLEDVQASECAVRSRNSLNIEVVKLDIAVERLSDYGGFDVQCADGMNGRANVQISGSAPPFSILWSNGEQDSMASALPVGEVSVRVADGRGCVADTALTLSAPDSLTLEASVTSDYNGADISSPGAMDGEALAVASGGVEGYTYTWNTNPPQTGPTATNLGAGIYEVVALDSNDCRASTTVIVRNPVPLSAEASVTTDYNGFGVSCAGENDGQVEVAVFGGIQPYEIVWQTDPPQMGPTASDLSEGTYTVRIRDAAGDSIFQQVSLRAPGNLRATLTPTAPICMGDSTGTITLEVSGGLAPYEIEWSTGEQGASIRNLISGNYTSTIRDNNDCVVVVSTSIQSESDLQLNLAASDITCFGVGDGFILSALEGGVPPFEFNWSNGETGLNVFNLEAGNYSVQVKDALGCALRDSAWVREPDSLTITVETRPDDGQGIGSASVSITGGVPPYQYNWSHAPQDTSREVQGLFAGSYSVSVTDGSGCSKMQSFEIGENALGFCPQIHMGFTPNGDGVNEFWHIPCLESLGDHSITILNRWGQVLQEFAPYDNTWNGTVNGQPLPEGTYFYIIRRLGNSGRRIFKGTISILR